MSILPNKLFFIRMIGLVLLVPLCFGCASLKPNPYDMTEITKPGKNGMIKGELIYPLDHKPTPQCHASTIENTASGPIAAWFGGTHEKNPDVGIWVSRLKDGKWSTPIEVANGIQSESLRYPCWNPVLFQPKSGPLMLFYKIGPSPREWWGMLTTSDDEGETWSEPVKLGEGPLGPILGPIKNKPIQLSDGTILCPSSTETKVGEEAFWKVHFESTKDLGKTWQVIGPINDGVAFDAIQPSILTYANGNMQILCRTRQNVISQSWSEDGGQSWGKMTPTPLPNPSAGTDAVTLLDGRQLLIYNHTVRNNPFPAGRAMLNLAISEDGKDWRPIMTLEREEGEFSYPAIIQSPDGLVHITYTYQRQGIKYVLIDPKKLK